jgi:hypothetical protein
VLKLVKHRYIFTFTLSSEVKYIFKVSHFFVGIIRDNFICELIKYPQLTMNVGGGAVESVQPQGVAGPCFE